VKNGNFFSQWGYALEGKQDLNGAIEKYQQQVESDGDEWTLERLTYIYQETGRYDEANRVFERLAADYPKACSWANWIGMLNKREKYDEALLVVEKALAANPAKSGVFHQWGHALEGKRDWTGAIEKYQRQVELDGDTCSAERSQTLKKWLEENPQ
jgi:tetratricopeptide (TPR) repeat protein